MTLIGCICWYVSYKNHSEIPSNSVKWVNLACKETITDNDNTSESVTKKAMLRIIFDHIKILPKEEKLSMA